MCGIFAYIGNQDAARVVAAGLKRLEYRGYDSWGIAVVDSDIHVAKKVGAIGDLVENIDLPNSSISIGHTRWATHGGISELNAHPHYSTDKSFALAQNGIVENFNELKAELAKKSYKFETETDTEVIVRLIESYHYMDSRFRGNDKQGDLKTAVSEAFKKLEGRNTIVLISKTGQIIACRNGSPLVIGKNFKTGEIYLSSDTLSFAPYAKHMVVVENGQLVSIVNKEIEISDLKTGKSVEFKFEDIGFEAEKIDKEGFDHFMLKEIYEAPFVINQLIAQDKTSYQEFAKVVKRSKNVYTIGSGGGGVAAGQVAFYLRDIGKVKAISLIGADAIEYQDLLQKDDLIIAISQSGETADVLEVLEPAQKKGVKIASFVNMPGSMITKMSDYKFMSQSGPEICVMSTKTFDAQVAFGYLLAKTIVGQGDDARLKLKQLAINIEKFLHNPKSHESIKKIAEMLVPKKDIFLLGKYQNFNIIKEGMVKVIEATYKHGHALPAGDLKHYVITLIEKGVAVVVAVSEDQVKKDILNAIHEVKSRGGHIIAIASKPHEDYDSLIKVPECGELSSIMNITPLHLLNYYMAVKLGNNVDKPRNIAKSVTVK
jgi:glutamine---fructose-6-phosphate transaminase (isomerizing)